MRGWRFALVMLAALAVAPAAWATFKEMPYYEGATPKALCYKIDPGMGDYWQAWVENAVANWNKANTGWTFKPCESADEKAHPDITIAFNDEGRKIPGGAKGRGRGGGADIGHWRILVEPNINGWTINGKTVKGGVGGTGWRMEDQAGETTLDPVLVLGHELGHALGLDHPENGAACDTGNLEEPICPGNHGKPVGRRPSQNDIDEVKRGIAEQQKKESDARKAAEGKDKHNALESAVLNEIDYVRGHPHDYAERLRRGPQTPATQDAIAYLEGRSPTAPLTDDPRLDDSAKGFANDAGPRGGVGHLGSDGSTEADRMKREGVWSMALAEAVALGQATGQGVVRQLIIDEGVPSRGHRTALMDPGYSLVGVGCGPHKLYKTICVIDLTGPVIAR